MILNPETSIPGMILSLIQSISLGVTRGILFGKGMVELINRIKLHLEGLYPVLTIVLAMLTFSLTNYAGGNGYLSVYI